MINLKKFVVVSVLFVMLAAPVFACMTIIVGKDVSSTGYVLVGHNEDDGERCKVEHGWVEPANWAPGSVLPAEKGRAAIPQVSRTYGYYWSQVKAATGGYSNADAFLNENGVWLVSNSCASSKEDTNDPSRVTDGGIEYNLRRVVAERATSARDAMNIIVDMIETWGYAPSGRAYTVADQNEAWMVQIVSGKHYVAGRCPDDQVIVMPNHYTFHDVFDMPFTEIIVPEDLVSYAVSKGWAKASEKFDFAKAYQAAGTYKSAGNTYRQYFAMSRLQDKLWEGNDYPFCIVPAGKVNVNDLMKILSDHYDGEFVDEQYLKAFGPGFAPHSTSLRRICTSSTVETSVCEFTDEPLTTTLWTAFGRGCELPYIPLHPLTKILPKEIDTMEDSAKSMANHLLPDAEMQVWKDTGWQKFRDFENKLELVYADEIDSFSKLKLTYEYRNNIASQSAVAQAQELLDSGLVAEATQLLADFDQAVTTEALGLVEEFAEDFNTAKIKKVDEISRTTPAETVKVVFTVSDGKPVENSIIFGMGSFSTRTSYASAIKGSLKHVVGNKWSVEFDTATLVKCAPVEGSFEHFIGGLLADGTSFVGQCQVKFI